MLLEGLVLVELLVRVIFCLAKAQAWLACEGVPFLGSHLVLCCERLQACSAKRKLSA